MKTNIKEQLTANPNYLIFAILLAEEDEHEPLFEIAGSELAGFRLLQNARVYRDLMKVHKPEDFPISLSPDGEIAKMPERVAGFIMAKKNWFWSMPTNHQGFSYNDSWLSSFSSESAAKLRSFQKEFLAPKESSSKLASPVSQ